MSSYIISYMVSYRIISYIISYHVSYRTISYQIWIFDGIRRCITVRVKKTHILGA